MNKIPFSPPFITPEVIKQVVESLNSGWITTGPKVQKFENRISEYLGCEQTVCVSNWTLGAMVLMKWFGVTAGDEVIVPAYTYSATALAALHLGATVVIVDVDDNFHLDATKLKNAITSKTKVIIPVDIGGLPQDYSILKQIVQDNASLFKASTAVQKELGRPMLLADAAHSFGAIFNGTKFNSYADFVVYSFHAVKNLTTAEGGAICFNGKYSDTIYKELKLYALNGQTKDAFSKEKAGSWEYDIILPGLKANMPDINASIGLAQLSVYDEITEKRKQIFKKYSLAFEESPYYLPAAEYCENNGTSYHLYMLRLKKEYVFERNSIIQKAADEGISLNVHFKPLPLLTLFNKMGFKNEDYPNANRLYNAEISLPIYPQLLDQDVERIIDFLKYRAIDV